MKKLYKKFSILATFIFLSCGLFSQDVYVYDTICEGYDYDNYGFFVIQPEAGLYQDTLWLTNIAGEDSIVRLSLFVNPSYEILLTETINYGEDYIENGFEYIQPEVGSYYDELFFFSMQGCDSIVYLELTVLPVTGVEEDIYQNAVVYPNPAKDNVMIECEDFVSVTIINTQGSVIKEAKESENNQIQMTVDDLPVGVYYLKINTKHGETIRKVLKTK